MTETGSTVEPDHYEARVTAERILWNFRTGRTSLRDPAMANLALAYEALDRLHSQASDEGKP